MREALKGSKTGVKFGGTKITNLTYADGTTLIFSNKEELMDLLSRVKTNEKKDLSTQN